MPFSPATSEAVPPTLASAQTGGGRRPAGPQMIGLAEGPNTPSGQVLPQEAGLWRQDRTGTEFYKPQSSGPSPLPTTKGLSLPSSSTSSTECEGPQRAWFKPSCAPRGSWASQRPAGVLNSRSYKAGRVD